MSLRIEQFGRVRRITLAAPALRNLLTTALASDILRELAQAESDGDTAAILLDSEGPVFCGGSDPAAELPDALFRFGCTARKPIVASVQGVAISTGLTLVANAHVTVAAQGSSFGLTDIREGRCDRRLLDSVSRSIGAHRTRELALTGRIFSTPEALAWGLVHAVTPAFELDDRASAIATGIANANADAVLAVLEAGH